jgi:hypothetical protein
VDYGVQDHFQQYFSYIVAVSFICKKYKTDVYREGRGVDISKYGTITCLVNMLTVISK